MGEQELGRIRIGRSSTVRGNAAVSRLKKGLDEAADAIGATLGPRGRLVIVQGEEGTPPVVTKDGVTVAKAIDPVDPVERMGAALVREAASRTNDEAGDGTTTASVLTSAMVASAVKFMTAGVERSDVKRGLDEAVAAISAELERSAERVDTEEALRDIATVSANGDVELGALVAQAVHRTGINGVVAVENARSSGTTLEVVEGARFDRGYLSPYFVTDKDKMRAVYEDCAVLITDRKLSSLRELVPLLEDCRRNGDRPLLIVAEEIEGEAMQGLVLNRVQGALKVVAVKLPGLGAHKDAVMHDLIALVGGSHPTRSSGSKLEEATVANIGRAKNVCVDSKITTVVGRADAKARVDARASELKAQLEDPSLSDADVTATRERLARLTSGAAVVKVGGATEFELVEKKYRIEDAIHAARAALEGGVLLGGGTALFRAGQRLRDHEPTKETLKAGDGRSAGWRVALDACAAPLRRIAANAGQSPDVVCQRCQQAGGNHGWDAKVGDIVDMRANGIVDPAKVTLSALKNAASVAGVFLQVDCVVHEPAEAKIGDRDGDR